jgi:hypothetical protein
MYIHFRFKFSKVKAVGGFRCGFPHGTFSRIKNNTFKNPGFIWIFHNFLSGGLWDSILLVYILMYIPRSMGGVNAALETESQK